ncbi:kinesin-like protein KIN-14A [Dioscorea cayenensis subsp. rotundata]|uniref:Kinesin-like protein KIN-14A n=1 Tax=Dioscorea cayennensis subsp. rotundata TaxID=55577 RepID=A0AB40BN81_DIOCR|nr:kinesin-like protein KIN-14A [Dioscorea cayenensis subsp. rotundata]
MSEPCRVSFRDGRLASRKAEEAAYRRYQASQWLEDMAGPLDLSPNPSEQEFVSCLRSGHVLCTAINKIQPGAVPKVVTIHSLGTPNDIQPLPAYQYFENVRNFLVAINELKLLSFEASDLEKDTVEKGSAAKIVDCVLSLKSYYEWKQCNGGSGPLKFVKSPLVAHSAGRTRSNAISSGSSISCRRLVLTAGSDKQNATRNKNLISEDLGISLSKVLSNCLLNSKENINRNLLDAQDGCQDSNIQLLTETMSSFLQDQKHNNLNCVTDNCKHISLLEAQQNELSELRSLLSMIKMEFVNMQTQLQNDLMLLGTYFQGLSAAASSYHQAVRENKHLYNSLQELRGNIRVFCRIRPSFNMEGKSSIDYTGNDGSLIVIDPSNPQSTRKIFHFNKIFGPDATQDEVYKDTQTLIRSVMDGYNVCIFAYGQTGSGKTHTMCGPCSGLNKNFGVSYMALNDLFQISSARVDIKYEIQAQMVEIYNEQVRDLLKDMPAIKLEIKNCSVNGGLSVPDASTRSVQSVDDVLNLMKLGEKNRVFSSTALNNRSSRSHSVLTVHIIGEDITRCRIRSCLHLVDLAGSERVDKSEVTGDRLKEAQHINRSLSCLGDVIAALAQKNSHIPYRNSKLTQLLQNSLGGHAKVLMLAHVSPEADYYGETVSTLKFAQRVSTVQLGAAHSNRESSEVWEIKRTDLCQQKIIESLKKALSRKEMEKLVPLCKMKENRPLEETQNHAVHTPSPSWKLNTESAPVKMVGPTSNSTHANVHNSLSQIVYTPTFSRRSSIDHPRVLKAYSTTKVVDEVFSKSPIKEPEIGTEHDSIRLRRLSTEGFKCLKPHSDIPKDGILSSAVSCKACQLLHLLNNPKTPSSARKLDEIVTPHEGGLQKMSQTIKAMSIANPSNKGSQIKKSLQTIGKLINGSEKRNICPTETPASIFGRSNKKDDKSPMTIHARARRRQSLTPIQTSGFSMSRRSSLGGKSPEPYSSDFQSTKTPLPTRSPPKFTKRWL